MSLDNSVCAECAHPYQHHETGRGCYICNCKTFTPIKTVVETFAEEKTAERRSLLESTKLKRLPIDDNEAVKAFRKEFESFHHDEESKQLKIEANQPMQILFYSSTDVLGRFFINDDKKFDFEGDRTESAEAFIENCKELWLEPEPDTPFTRYYLDEQEAEFIDSIRETTRNHPNLSTPLDWEHEPEPETVKKSIPLTRESVEELYRNFFPEKFMDVPFAVEENNLLFCANCGQPVFRGETAGQYHFSCECAEKPVKLRPSTLLTDDPLEHIRRKQLKN